MFDNTVVNVCILSILALLCVIVFLIKRINYLRVLSETDQMTSLMNYRGLCKNIESFIKHKVPFSLAIIDIDDFGKINKHSYQSGDEVLKEFAALLIQSFSDNTLLARFRLGDEFIIIFKDRNLQYAKIKIDELKEKFKNHNFISLENFSVNTVSFSEGIAEINTKTNTLEVLFSEAEKSLKVNKLQKNTSVPLAGKI